MSPDEEYSTAIDHAVADAVRATLIVPHTSLQGAHQLRQVTTRLSATHGPVAVRDLAEALAADLAELLGAFAETHQRDPLAVLDEWTHDEPLPFSAPGSRQDLGPDSQRPKQL